MTTFTPIKPMLAQPYKERMELVGGYVQPKLDGIRMIWDGPQGVGYSRTGKLITGVPSIIEALRKHAPNKILDGELYKHGKSFQEFTGSIRRSKNVEEDLDIKYCVYDTLLTDTPYTTRYSELKSLNPTLLATGKVALVDTYHIYYDPACVLCPKGICSAHQPAAGQCRVHEKQFTEAGYEGAIWRDTKGLYLAGKRSSGLVKFKSFEDAEFEVTGAVEMMRYEKDIVPAGTPGAKQYADGSWYKNGDGTPQDVLGALVCKTKEGKKFEVGSGFDDATRQALWKARDGLVGSVATVKYFELTDGGVPRHPVFKAIRAE